MSDPVVHRLDPDKITDLALRLQDVLIPAERKAAGYIMQAPEIMDHFASLHVVLAAVRRVLEMMHVKPEALEETRAWAEGIGVRALPENGVQELTTSKKGLTN